MESPITSFLSWYKSLPVPHRQDIASFITAFSPGYEEDNSRASEEVVSLFEKKLLRYENDKFLGVGYCLGLRSGIEFFFMRTRGSHAGWDETGHFLAGAREFFGQQGNKEMVENAEMYLREVPFKEKQWIITSKSWQDLLANHFSDEYIDQWWKKA